MPDRLLGLECLEPRQLLAADLMITEFLARNDAGLRDANGNSPDWVEIYNAGDTAANLQGYRLTDDAAEPTKWTFPSVDLNPGQYRVVFASGQETNDFVDSAGNLHTNFTLRRSGDYLALIAPDGQVVSEFGSSETNFTEQLVNVSFGVAQKQHIIGPESDTVYTVPLDASIDATWMRRDFDTAAHGFVAGKAATGYESRPDDRVNFTSEIQTELRDRTQGVYVRIPFDLTDASAVRELKLRLRYDNGFIAYLNGDRVAEDNAPASPSWFSTAPEVGRRDSDVLDFVEFDLGNSLERLVDGENVLALHGINSFQDNSDMLLVAEMIAVIPDQLDRFGFMPDPSPGRANGETYDGFVADTQFSIDRGFYDSPQQVEVTTETTGAAIYYTTDGSEPNPASGSTTRYAAPLTIGETTTLRAAAFREGFLPTNIDTQTYVFVNDVARQRAMKSRVANDPVWGPQIADSLLSIPTVSLVTAATVGESTQLRESATSVEFILPDGSDGFQVDAGVEHFGGHTLTNSNKKNMRLSFKSIYGPPRLRYDLFGEGATDDFDQLLLRTGSHDNWFWTHPSGGRGIYIRNRWASDRQLEMGQPAPHGRFVHVYLNGAYWGMHQLMERPDAAFMASYFGGEPEDFDALNAGTAVDGDTAAWTALRTAAGDFAQLQQYVDLENYADYMLLQFYGGNDWDWNTAQNWMAARRREEGAGWKFFSWDSDLMLRTGPRANVVSRGGPGNLWGPVSQHEEFRMLLADRAQKYFFHDGMLTPERVLSQFDELASDIRLPIVAETARWTGTNSTPAYTPDTWEEQLERVGTQIILERTEIVVDQLRRARMFPEIDAPTFWVNAAPQHGGIIGDESQFAIAAPDGSVYFTLDGSDPRLPGGEVAPGASVFAEPITLPNNATVKARALHDGEWSALSEATYFVQSQTGLRITEINFHPHPPNLLDGLGETDGEADSFEFIELTNVSGQALDLAGVQLVEASFQGRNQGIAFRFSPQILVPGEQIVVVRDLASFQSRYGPSVRIAAGNDGRDGAEGEFGGELSNRAERLTLLDADGATIHQFSYGTGEGWPKRAAGLGSSLKIINVDGNYSSPENWRASDLFGGSPGTHGANAAASIVINEVLASPRPGESDRMELFNVSSQDIDIQNWYVSNSAGDYFRAQIVSPTVIPSGGYVILDESQLGFDFDGARGDEVWLIAADESGRPRSFVDYAGFDNAVTDVSLGRWPNGSGEFFAMAEVTMGSVNSDRRISDVIISEVHFSPLDPDRERPQKPDDFEFIELYNRTDSVVDLTGLRLAGGVEFTFAPGTIIEPRDTAVIVPFRPDNVGKINVFRFILGTAADLPLTGPYEGQLGDEGDSVRLELRAQPPADDPAFVPYVVIDAVNFGVEDPWPGETSGTGNSLTRIRPDAYGNDASSWNGTKASPGLAEFQPRAAGDANEDGRFDQRDVVLVLKGGKYLTGLPASWRDGDFNADTVFDQEDIVAALQAGSYLQNSSAAYRNAGRGKPTASTHPIDPATVDGLFRELP